MLETTTSPTTRERILEAAGETFAEVGYRDATVRRICDRAEVNVAAIHYHFGDKERLHRETIRWAFARAHEQHPSPETSEGVAVATSLRAFVTSFLQRILAVDRGWHGRLIARELADPTGALEEVVETFMRPMLGHLDAIIADARPDLSAESRRLHCLSLIGQCVFFKHARPVLDILFGQEVFDETQIPTLTEHIVGIFLRGLGLDDEGVTR